MTVSEIVGALELNPISLPDKDREISGVYVGDLLSWVMGKAECGCAWITIMSNVNIVAVATLADVSCIILAEGVSLDPDTVTTASQKGVNILSTDMSAYEIAVALHGELK